MPIIRSLPVKVIMVVVITVAVTLVSGFAFFLKHERKIFSDAKMNEAAQLSNTVLASMSRSMMDNDNRQTVELMKNLTSTQSVDHLMIINSKGTIALAAHSGEEGKHLDSPDNLCEACHQRTPRKIQMVFKHTKPDGEEVFRNAIAILNRPGCKSCHQDRFLGLLISDIEATGLAVQEASQIKNFSLLALILFSVITISLLLMFNILIRKPIKILIRGTKEMARGNYAHRLPEKTKDEFGILSRSFNEMAEKVDHSRTVLEKWNVSLEEEVERRTRELKTSNIDLHNEKNQTVSIIHSIVEGILTVAPDGAIVLASTPAADIFGRQESSLIGIDIGNLLHASSERFQNFEEVERLILGGEASEGYLGIVQQIQPQRRTFKLSRSRIHSSHGENSGWVYSFHDITREKEIDEIKTNLVAMVSHELRTPLTAIKGSLSLLADEKLKDSNEREEFQAIALTNTDRLIELINNLLDLSKIESGSIFYEHGTFYLENLLQQCCRAVTPFAKRNNVEISLEIGDGLEEMNGDESKMEQVIINLLSNAIKFSPGGGKVTVSATGSGSECTISVADTGIGIPFQEKEKIFEKFYQVDMSPVRLIGGSGLGLSICKAIVEGHGGHIWVESEPGKGSTFSLCLPKAFMQTTDVEKAVRKITSRTGDKIPHRILIVEDEISVRKILTKYLQEKGFEVFQATSAKEALDMARLRRPDCITMDVMLPDLDGFDLTAVLKSDPNTSNIPIIFITVVEGPGKERGLKLGAHAYFTKPVSYDMVVDKIESLLVNLGVAEMGRRILLVDDEPDVIRPLGAYLEQRDYKVSYAYSGSRALEIFSKTIPDILILDLRMPNMSGYDLIRKLKENPEYARVPIVVITASEGDQSRKKVFDLGAAAFLHKPIAPEILCQEIERIIN